MTRNEHDMSREEAIDLLDNLIGMVEDNHESDYDTALQMGIKSLEYDDAKYHEEHGEVIVDKAVWEDVKKALEQSHDGCKDCKYETYPEYYYPCCECKQNYVDEWQKKPHWNHGVCDNCGYDWGKDAPIASVPNFCPNCGSPMEIER